MNRYGITDGTLFLTQQMALTEEKWGWKTEDAAQRFLETWKVSKKRTIPADGFQVVEIQNDDTDAVCTASVFSAVEVLQQEENNSIPADLHADDCMTLISDIHDKMERIKRRSEYLGSYHAEIEREIMDLEHYIELADRKNAVEGYKLYAQLRELLLKRRYVKDELLILGTLEANGWEGNYWSAVQAQCKGLCERKYNPRSKGRIAALFETV